MSDANYDESLSRVLEHEGGYSNDAGDPGGPTKYGITIWDARAYWKKNATAADVKAMPLAVAKEIYRTKYWGKMDCGDLPDGIDYAVFDFGVNSGIARSAKYLQALVGSEPDGIIGPRTVAATREADATVIITQLCDNRLAFLQGLSTWRRFGKGWGRRVREVKAAALAMAAKAAKASA